MQNRPPEYPDPTQMFTMWQQMYTQWMSMFMAGMPGMPGTWPGTWPGGMPATPGTPAAPGVGMAAINELELAIDGRTTKVSLAWSRPTLGSAKARLRHDKTQDELAVEVSEQGKLKIQLSANQPPGHYTGDLKDRSGSRCGLIEAVVSE